VQTFRSARHGRPEGLHYTDLFTRPVPALRPFDKAQGRPEQRRGTRGRSWQPGETRAHPDTCRGLSNL